MYEIKKAPQELLYSKKNKESRYPFNRLSAGEMFEVPLDKMNSVAANIYHRRKIGKIDSKIVFSVKKISDSAAAVIRIK